MHLGFHFLHTQSIARITTHFDSCFVCVTWWCIEHDDIQRRLAFYWCPYKYQNRWKKRPLFHALFWVEKKEENVANQLRCLRDKKKILKKVEEKTKRKQLVTVVDVHLTPLEQGTLRGPGPTQVVLDAYAYNFAAVPTFPLFPINPQLQ